MTTQESAPRDGSRTWFGYTDYEFLGPDGQTRLSLPYEAEPPHGDSLHRVIFSNIELPGFAWGNGVAWSPCARYVLFDYSQDRHNLSRDVAVLDLRLARYHLLPEYVVATRLDYPNVFIRGPINEVVAYSFSGNEEWQSAAQHLAGADA